MFIERVENDFVNLKQVVNVYYIESRNKQFFIDINGRDTNIEDEYVEEFIKAIKSLCK